MHAQGADEIALHQPEGLGQKEGIGRFLGHAVHHLAPELLGHSGVELGPGQPMLCPGGDVAAAARLREPQALVVPLGQGHGGVEADDGEVAGHVQDGLDDGLAHLRVQIVQLSGVVPGHGGAIVAVVDVLLAPCPAVQPLEDHGGVGAGVVVILYEDAYPLVP